MRGSRWGRHCLGFLRPIVAPIWLLVLIGNAALFLSWARVNYSMHVVSPDDVWQHKLDGTPIPVYSETIPLDVRLYGVCGQTSKLEQIQKNKKILFDAGNHSSSQPVDKAYTSRLQLLLHTKLRGLAVCDDETNNVSEDVQLATWVAAGLAVSLLLILAGFVSLLAVVLHAITVKKRAADAPHRYKASVAVEMLSEAASWIAFFSIVLYTTFTWSDRSSANSSYGPGYIVVLVTIIAMGCGRFVESSDGVRARLRPAIRIRSHKNRRETSTSALPNIV